MTKFYVRFSRLVQQFVILHQVVNLFQTFWGISSCQIENIVEWEYGLRSENVSGFNYVIWIMFRPADIEVIWNTNQWTVFLE